jgi:hypothetical protein
MVPGDGTGMTADSELFVTETVSELLGRKIKKLIPNGYYINVQIPPRWWGIWGAAGFPNRGEADVTLWEDDCKGAKLGVVSWETKFSVADYGGPAKCIEAWPTNLRFRKEPSSRRHLSSA